MAQSKRLGRRTDSPIAGSLVVNKKPLDCFEAFTEESLYGCSCWSGMDLAIVNDLCSVVHVFRCGDENEEHKTELFRVIARHWLPAATVKKKKDLVSFQQWADEGWLTITDGDEVDFNRVIDDIAADAEKFAIQDVRYDRAYGATVAQTLELMHGITRKEFPQTIMNFTFPCKMFERLISKRAIKHNGNKVLTWQIGNVRTKSDANDNIRPIKPAKNDHRKIDGVVALLMGLSGAIGDSEPETKHDYYNNHDPEWV